MTLLAIIHKELLLLSRDRAGLLVLFVMPAVLVLVITLVQNNLMKTFGAIPTEMLFVDEDQQFVGQRMAQMFTEADGIILVRERNGQPLDRATAMASVTRGAFQFCLVIPKGLSASVKENAHRAALKSLSMAANGPAVTAGDVEIYFDPTVTGAVRSGTIHLLQLMLVRIEIEEIIAAMAELMPDKIKTTLSSIIGDAALQTFPIHTIKPDVTWNSSPLFNVRADTSTVAIPNAVQQNVPAWTLFGIFFIVLPMAGSFIRERSSGVRYRMLSLPVSYLTIVAGKMGAYIIVCLCQTALILTIGKWVLPLAGTATFEMGASPGAVVFLALSAIIAATGYGILLGTAARSYEQASMFGPISIVIAAAIGGIMVPVYAMPDFMQPISIISPLCWAQNGFLEIFVRGGNVQSVVDNIIGLLAFAGACLGLSWVIFKQSRIL